MLEYWWRCHLKIPSTVIINGWLQNDDLSVYSATYDSRRSSLYPFNHAVQVIYSLYYPIIRCHWVPNCFQIKMVTADKKWKCDGSCTDSSISTGLNSFDKGPINYRQRINIRAVFSAPLYHHMHRPRRNTRYAHIPVF